MRPRSLATLAIISIALLSACEQRKSVETPVPALAAAASSAEPLSFDEALVQARARQAPLLIDFHAPWCYSCYYMATHVLSGPEWQAVEKRAVVLAVDADSPAGGELRERYGIKALPSYLVLDSEGRELGRILAEKTRAEFYPELNAMLDRGLALSAVALEVKDGSAASIAAARTVLASHLARYDADGGLQWLQHLPEPAQQALQADGGAALLIRRLQFLQAIQKQDQPAALRSGREVLAGELGCERAYELDRYRAVAAQQPQAKALLAAQRPALDRLLADGVFGARPCADQRAVVLAAAELYAALGDTAAQQALLRRAMAAVDAQIAGDYRKDRNLDDNLRVYTEQLALLNGDYTALDRLLPKLIAAWPQDYVYAYRHGRSLLARGQAAQALPLLEQAAQQAYGINRLKVAEQRVLALQALQRETDARRVVAEALKANGPWFPDEAAKLKAVLKE